MNRVGDREERTTSRERKRLASLLNDIHFGQVVNLSIRDGEPTFESDTKVCKEIVFGSDRTTSAAPPLDPSGFHQQIYDLFDAFDRIGDGRISLLEVRHGLPFRARLDLPVGSR